MSNNSTILTKEILKDQINDSKRITKPYLTKYEMARIIGYRSEQIGAGSQLYIDPGNITNVIDIAKKELYERKIPFIIKRTLPNNISEYWKLDELEIIDY